MPDGMRAAQFSTGALARQVRYDAWRHLISAVFEPTLPNGQRHEDMRAEASVAYFGNALVVSATAEAQHFTRSPRLIAAEGLDHYIVQLYRAGTCEGTYSDVRNIVHPGDIKIIDLARPFHTFNTDFDNISLTLPRAALAPLLANPDGLHGAVLHRDTAEARVLALPHQGTRRQRGWTGHRGRQWCCRGHVASGRRLPRRRAPSSGRDGVASCHRDR